MQKKILPLCLILCSSLYSSSEDLGLSKQSSSASGLLKKQVEEIGEGLSASKEDVVKKKDISVVVDLTDSPQALIKEKEYFFERYIDGERVVQYTDEIPFFQLKDDTSKEYVTTMSKLALQDYGKNHMTAALFFNSKGGVKRTPCKTKLFSTAEGEEEDKIIDWGSNQAKALHQKCTLKNSTAYGGHSEPQFIADFDAVWKKDFQAVLSQLFPVEIDEDELFYGAGIELYESFDSCDDCTHKLLQFRKEHSEGQMSFASAVRDELQHRRLEMPKAVVESFSLVNHSYFPYQKASYCAGNIPLGYKASPRER